MDQQQDVEQGGEAAHGTSLLLAPVTGQKNGTLAPMRSQAGRPCKTRSFLLVSWQEADADGCCKEIEARPGAAAARARPRPEGGPGPGHGRRRVPRRPEGRQARPPGRSRDEDRDQGEKTLRLTGRAEDRQGDRGAGDIGAGTEGPRYRHLHRRLQRLSPPAGSRRDTRGGRDRLPSGLAPGRRPAAAPAARRTPAS